MDLRTITATPQLTKLTLDDEDTIKIYGEPLDFYTWDRQPLDVFLKFSVLDRGDFSAVVMLLKDLILNADGSKVLVEGVMLPPTVLVKVVVKMTETLGK
jgi:hypothetical protein